MARSTTSPYYPIPAWMALQRTGVSRNVLRASNVDSQTLNPQVTQAEAQTDILLPTTTGSLRIVPRVG